MATEQRGGGGDRRSLPSRRKRRGGKFRSRAEGARVRLFAVGGEEQPAERGSRDRGRAWLVLAFRVGRSESDHEPRAGSLSAVGPAPRRPEEIQEVGQRSRARVCVCVCAAFDYRPVDRETTDRSAGRTTVRAALGGQRLVNDSEGKGAHSRVARGGLATASSAWTHGGNTWRRECPVFFFSSSADVKR